MRYYTAPGKIDVAIKHKNMYIEIRTCQQTIDEIKSV